MANILPDNQIEKIIGKIIIDGAKSLINPNGIELRLGKQIYFHSTQEEFELNDGYFLKIEPGETVSFTSIEQIDFTKKTVEEFFPGCMLMGLITPTTTMMREGISQVTTKIDAGFKGILNWSLRNGSSKEVVLQYKEPIFKLTIFKLENDEKPSLVYGEREKDSYHEATGITHSTRKIPVNIPKNKLVQSNIEKLDPKKQLKEAGYPFNYIGTELTELQGKFEIVSKDVLLIKEEFAKKTSELSSKIEKETTSLISKLEATESNIFAKTKYFFNNQFLKIAGIMLSALAFIYSVIRFLNNKFNNTTTIIVAFIAGIVILALTLILTHNTKNNKNTPC